MIAIPAVVFHAVVGTERLVASIVFIFFQQERKRKNAGSVVRRGKVSLLFEKGTIQNELIEDTPLATVPVGTSLLPVHQIIQVKGVDFLSGFSGTQRLTDGTAFGIVVEIA